MSRIDLNRWAYVLGLSKAPRPQTLMVENTNHCNLKCVMCPHSTGFSESKGRMDMALYRDIIDQAAEWGIPNHTIHKGGEVLLDNRWHEMVSFSKSAGIPFVYFVSNGTLLDKNDNISKILESGLNMIRFSIDGGTPDEFEKIRKISWIQIVENINELCRRAAERHSRLRVELNNLMPATGGERMFQSRMDFLRSQFPLIAEKSIHVRFFVEWPGESVESKEIEFIRPQGTYTGACQNPYNSIVINWDGNYVPCCQDIEGKVKIEDARRVRLKEFWNGESYRKFRRDLTTGTAPESFICKKCPSAYRSSQGFLRHLLYSIRPFLSDL